MPQNRKTPYVAVNMTVQARDELRGLLLRLPNEEAGRRITISDAVRALVRLAGRDPREVAQLVKELDAEDHKG